MKKPYLLPAAGCLLALAALPLAGRAQAPTPDWQVAVAATHGPNSTSETRGSATDAAGNVYLTGQFTGAVTFGTTTLTSAGGTDVFIAKWDNAAHAFAWARQAGGLANDQANGLAVSGTSIYVAGVFASPTATFGPTALTNAGNATTTDVFVAKLTDAGAFTWAQRAGSPDGESCTAVAAAGSSVYLAGNFAGATTSFGPLSLANLGSATTYDNFVAKLTDAGTTASFAWAQRFGGASYDYCEGLAVSGPSVYVSGSFSQAATFGSLALTSSANGSLFVAKLTDAGSSAAWVWVQPGGGPGGSTANALAVSGTSLYVGGLFVVPFTLGATATFGSTTLTSSASGDEFLAKLTDAGSSATWVWAKQAGNPYINQLGQIGGIKCSGSSVYVLGSFYGTTQAFGSTTRASVGLSDVFLTKLTDLGPNATTAWVQQAGGTGDDYGNALALGAGTVFAAGNAKPTASFGSQVIPSAAGASVGFLAALADATALASTPAAATPLALAAYPNPAHRTTTVQLPAGLAAGPATFTLLDAVGRVVRTRTAPVAAGTPPTDLDVAGLAPGVYALRVAVGERLGTARLVVE